MPRRYASYLAGAAAARTGDEMSGPALLLAGYAVAGPAAEASALLAGITVSAAVGGPVLGALLDRSARPGRLLAGALALYVTGLTAALLSLGRLPIEVTFLIAVFAGLAGPALSGGWTAQLPRVVPHGSLPRANALDAMTFSLASLVGPALAGATAELLGARSAVVASVALIGLALPVAWRLPVRSDPRPSAASAISDLVTGIRFIARTRPLARATLTSVISCMGQGMLIACVPLLGERALGGAGHGALLLSGAAVASLAANAVLARRPRAIAPDTIVRCGSLAQAAAMLLAATGRPALVITAAAITGAGEGPQLAALFAIRHREAPDHLRSQIFTTGASLKITAFAVGAATAGPLATGSLPTALLTAAGVHLLAATSGYAFAAVCK